MTKELLQVQLEVVRPSGKRLHASRFFEAEGKRNTWRVFPDGSTTYEELFEANWWGLVAAKLRRYDFIEVIADNDSYFAELLVMSVGKTQAFMKELRKIDISISEMAEADESYDAKWKGPYSKWAVIRESDGTKIKDGFDTADDARAYILANNKKPTA